MKNLALIHVLDKTTDTPPAAARQDVFMDAFGNTFRLVFHKTPTAGVATLAAAPVGWVDGADLPEQVTADISQSDVSKCVGPSMVAVTEAESLAGIWHWVMVRGCMKEYKSGGKGIPIQPDPNDAFDDSAYGARFTPIAFIPTDDSIADGTGLLWGDDNVWDVASDARVGVVCGRSREADGGTANLDPEAVDWDCPSGYTFVDTA